MCYKLVPILLFILHLPVAKSHVHFAKDNSMDTYEQQHILTDKSHLEEKEHIREHLGGIMNSADINIMAEEELRFHYFKMHDDDDNNKLDGCEIVKSLLHWHVEEFKALGFDPSNLGTTKIFTDQELELMVDPILETDDRNNDGFIDYPEFVAAQKSRGF